MSACKPFMCHRGHRHVCLPLVRLGDDEGHEARGKASRAKARQPACSLSSGWPTALAIDPPIQGQLSCARRLLSTAHGYGAYRPTSELHADARIIEATRQAEGSETAIVAGASIGLDHPDLVRIDIEQIVR